MQPHDTTIPAGSKPPLRSNTMRYVVTVALLVLIVGGIAWVAQYLPSWKRGNDPPPPPPEERKKLLTFAREVAHWRTTAPKEVEKGNEDPTEQLAFVEPGTKGHYDFLFENTTGTDVQLAWCKTSCDCASVKAVLLSASEWQAVNQQQEAKPGLPLLYAKEPDWQPLPPDKESAAKGTGLHIKAGERGAVRVEWTAGAAGATLKLFPRLYLHPAAEPSQLVGQELIVPGMVVPIVQVDKDRLTVGPLNPGKSDTKFFYAWSSTRESLDLSVFQDPPDPLFDFSSIQRLSKEDAAKLQAKLIADKFVTKVTCAYQVNVTVHESKDGKFLDHGSFYRKLPFALDGRVDTEKPLWGPEIVGRTAGDIDIGGSEDHGRIQLKSFSAKEGTSREVYLTTGAKVELEKTKGLKDQPRWLEVNLKRDEKELGSDRVRWILKVDIPKGAALPGRFDEPSAVILRIAGTTRLLRIPLEGHITE